MADRIASDHPSVTTVDATVERAGRTDCPKLVLPPEAASLFPDDEVVRVVLDGTKRARLAYSFDDEPEIRGVYDTPDQAREGRGDNRLPDWLDAQGLDFGRTVHVDVVEAEFEYGLRAPGEHRVYEATEAPDSGLADIARQVEDRD